MTRRKEDPNPNSQLDRDLAELKLPEIAKSYREVLDDAARKGSSPLEVLRTLSRVRRWLKNRLEFMVVIS
jgi:hypothetical protein